MKKIILLLFVIIFTTSPMVVFSQSNLQIQLLFDTPEKMPAILYQYIIQDVVNKGAMTSLLKKCGLPAGQAFTPDNTSFRLLGHEVDPNGSFIFKVEVSNGVIKREVQLVLGNNREDVESVFALEKARLTAEFPGATEARLPLVGSGIAEHPCLQQGKTHYFFVGTEVSDQTVGESRELRAKLAPAQSAETRVKEIINTNKKLSPQERRDLTEFLKACNAMKILQTDGAEKAKALRTASTRRFFGIFYANIEKYRAIIESLEGNGKTLASEDLGNFEKYIKEFNFTAEEVARFKIPSSAVLRTGAPGVKMVRPIAPASRVEGLVSANPAVRSYNIGPNNDFVEGLGAGAQIKGFVNQEIPSIPQTVGESQSEVKVLSGQDATYYVSWENQDGRKTVYVHEDRVADVKALNERFMAITRQQLAEEFGLSIDDPMLVQIQALAAQGLGTLFLNTILKEESYEADHLDSPKSLTINGQLNNGRLKDEMLSELAACNGLSRAQVMALISAKEIIFERDIERLGEAVPLEYKMRIRKANMWIIETYKALLDEMNRQGMETFTCNLEQEKQNMDRYLTVEEPLTISEKIACGKRNAYSA